MHVTPWTACLCAVAWYVPGSISTQGLMRNRVPREQPQCSQVYLRIGCLHPYGTFRRVVCLQGQEGPLCRQGPTLWVLLPVARSHRARASPCISGSQEQSRVPVPGLHVLALSQAMASVTKAACLLEAAGSRSPQKAQGLTAVGTAVRMKELPTNQEHLLSPPLFPRCPSPRRGQVGLCEASSRPPSFVLAEEGCFAKQCRPGGDSPTPPGRGGALGSRTLQEGAAFCFWASRPSCRCLGPYPRSERTCVRVGLSSKLTAF